MHEKRIYPFLFHSNFKVAGIILLVPALFFTFFRFYLGEKPEFLKHKILAIYSSFLETKYFTLIENNLSEEICGLTLLISLVFIAFSKEKNENESYWQIRLNSVFLALYLNILFLLLSLLFVYGLAFVEILILNMYLFLIFYSVIFNYKLKKEGKAISKERITEPN